MERDRHSRTAEAAASARAMHMRRTNDPVFEDTWAFDLLGPRARRLATNPILRGLQRLLLGNLAPMAEGQVNLRSRFAEDALEKAVAAGATQYVLLSAGLDSFALRRPDLLQRLRVFEVDHPATQEFKRERLAKLGAKLPSGLEFAPVDFECEGIAEGLARTSYASRERTFFSWLGTVPYLTEDATFTTLRALVELSPPGSELVFDFGGPLEGIEGPDRRAIERLQRYTARRGEPLVSFGDPEQLLRQICALGFERIEVLDAQEQERRYLSGRTDGLRTFPMSYLAHLRRT